MNRKDENNKIIKLTIGIIYGKNRTLLTFVSVEDTCLVDLSTEHTHCHHVDGSSGTAILSTFELSHLKFEICLTEVYFVAFGCRARKNDGCDNE